MAQPIVHPSFTTVPPFADPLPGDLTTLQGNTHLLEKTVSELKDAIMSPDLEQDPWKELKTRGMLEERIDTLSRELQTLKEIRDLKKVQVDERVAYLTTPMDSINKLLKDSEKHLNELAAIHSKTLNPPKKQSLKPKIAVAMLGAGTAIYAARNQILPWVKQGVRSVAIAAIQWSGACDAYVPPSSKPSPSAVSSWAESVLSFVQNATQSLANTTAFNKVGEFVTGSTQANKDNARTWIQATLAKAQEWGASPPTSAAEWLFQTKAASPVNGSNDASILTPLAVVAAGVSLAFCCLYAVKKLSEQRSAQPQ